MNLYWTVYFVFAKGAILPLCISIYCHVIKINPTVIVHADQMNQHRTMNMTHDAFDASLAMRAICLVPFPESEGGKQCDLWIISIGEWTLIIGKHRTRREKREERKSCEIRVKLSLTRRLIQPSSIYRHFLLFKATPASYNLIYVLIIVIKRLVVCFFGRGGGEEKS